MTNLQVPNADIIQFLGTYERMIENFERTANPLHDIESINYVFYISKANTILAENILHSITISGVTYYYTVNTYRDRTYNRIIKNLLVYDTNFTPEDIIDFASTRTNIPRSVLERCHYYLWNGSHLNIAPILKRQLINYHHTDYIVNQTDSRLPAASIQRKWCKFTIPDYMLHGLSTPCFNENPPKILDQVQGRRLSSLDGQVILNTMLNLPLPEEITLDNLDGGGIFSKYNKISKLYKNVKNKIPKLTLKKETQLDLFKQNLTKYIQTIASQNNIKLLHNTAVICNPLKINSYGIVILNVNIDIEDNNKGSSKSSQSSSSKAKKCKGYYKTFFKVKDIYQMTK